MLWCLGVIFCVAVAVSAADEAGDRVWVSSSAECRAAELRFLSVFLPQAIDGSTNFTASVIDGQRGVEDVCNHTHQWLAVSGDGSSLADKAVQPLVAIIRKRTPLDPNILISSLLHAVLDATQSPPIIPEHTSRHHLDEVVAVQLQSPVLSYLSPKMWWLRSDPMTSKQCSLGRAASYLGSWVMSAWFIFIVQLVFESRDNNEWAKRQLVFSGLSATISSFLNAVVTTTCLSGVVETANISSCVVESRQRFGFVWPAAIITLFGLVRSLEAEKMNPKVEAFVYNYQAALQPIDRWQQGDILARGGKQAGTRTVVSNSALRLPAAFRDFSQYFQVGIVALVGTIGVWLMSCPYQ